jgi:hypothetical protein
MAVNDIVMGAAGASSPATYIEDVFSTYLYTGNDGAQTITNNIDVSTKGALVWIKARAGTYGTQSHCLINTPISNTVYYSSNTTGNGTGLGASAFTPTTSGFNLNSVGAIINNSATTYASWTFRKQPKFFDIVTYTGDGSDTREVPHNLGSTPGTIIIKSTGTSNNWVVWHRSAVSPSTGLPNSSNAAGAKVRNALLFLNTTSSVADLDNSIKAPSSTTLYFGDRMNATEDVNVSGRTYVAYIFAHNAGGFGATGTDNVISCGSYTGNGGTQSITLGYEPQWLLIKKSNGIGSWFLMDNMRGLYAPTASGAVLFPNNTNAENAIYGDANVNSTGFTALGGVFNNTGDTYIYIAIRRPMKTPTTGTEVFSPKYETVASNATTTLGFTFDMFFQKWRNSGENWAVQDSLRGISNNAGTDSAYSLASNSTASEVNVSGSYIYGRTNTAAKYGSYWNGFPTSTYFFGRAPGFFDVVCYTGTGANRTVNHNLTVAPEMMIVKSRSSSTFGWFVYHSSVGNTKYLQMDTNAAPVTNNEIWNNTSPTSTVFTIGTSAAVNAVNQTEVVYLFATCAGVSKVGSYTGNGSSQTINCGFTTGARFIMIKCTSATGDWKVIDSARGIVAGNDPTLALNTTAAEVTGTDCIDPDSSGFIVNQETTNNLNVNGASYIFLSIA